MDEQTLGSAIENLLVARNPRGMKTLQAALEPGYYLRAARLLHCVTGTVLIGTGFPAGDSFETDGPVGAIALYDTLKTLGAEPVIVCGKPLSDALRDRYRVHEIGLGVNGERASGTQAALRELSPQLIISIELPGLSAQGGYFNMNGVDITHRCPCFDPFVELADCPTIAIGDGGNEIGMGKVPDAVESLDIVPAVTGCDELLVADVSNWGAYGLMALIGFWRGEDLLGEISPPALLRYLNERGGIDGVTGERAPTEDGFDAAEGVAVIDALRDLSGGNDGD